MQSLQEPITIEVQMEVTRYQEFPEDGFAQVHGYVGDYEISLCIALSDKRVKQLKKKKGTPGDR